MLCDRLRFEQDLYVCIPTFPLNATLLVRTVQVLKQAFAMHAVAAYNAKAHWRQPCQPLQLPTAHNFIHFHVHPCSILHIFRHRSSLGFLEWQFTVGSCDHPSSSLHKVPQSYRHLQNCTNSQWEVSTLTVRCQAPKLPKFLGVEDEKSAPPVSQARRIRFSANTRIWLKQFRGFIEVSLQTKFSLGFVL